MAALLLLFVVLGYGVIRAFAVARGPALVLPRYPVSLGDGKPGQTLNGYFDLFNAGDEPLTFKLTPGCNCSSLSPREGSIPAGESQRVAIGIKLGGVYGASKSVIVTINSNDVSQPETSYHVTADCPLPFNVTPRSVDFGPVLSGTERKVTLRIRSPERKHAPPPQLWTA